MAEFDAKKRQHRFDARRRQHTFNAQQRRHTFSATAPSEVQEDTGPIIVDGFESGDLSNYTGDTVAWGVDTTTPVFEGAYSAKCGTANTTIISTAGLNAYPSQGDTMAAQVYGSVDGTSAVAPQVAYFVQDIDNFYLAEVVVSTNRIRLYKKEVGSFTALATASVTVNNQTEYRLHMNPQSDGTHTISLHSADGATQLASASTTDTTFTAGGIGLRQGDTGSVVADNLRLI